MARVDREAKNAYWREWYARNRKSPSAESRDLTVMTRSEVAAALGVSAETVRQAEKSGLAKLRRALAEWGPECAS
jgi:DNA-binding XRE family transcriptional regulator